MNIQEVVRLGFITEQKAQDMERNLEKIKREPLVKKYMYEYTWLSGSSTYVSPISIYYVSSTITIQWKSHKNIFNKFIQRIIDNSEGFLIDGYFAKNDDSCPAEIVFKFK
jgi:hypothetical protein